MLIIGHINCRFSSMKQSSGVANLFFIPQVLDATFDDIVPLAQCKMPESISMSSTY